MTAATAPHDPLAALCSPYTGIVSTVEECLCMPTDARLIRVACELASSSSLLGASLRHIQGVGGAGFTLAEARAAAVGEAAERYSASHLPRERFVEASADELGAGAVDPERFALFARDQYETDGFPFVPFHRGTRVQWVEGIALPGREPAWIPVELVYLADAIEPGRPRIGYATSSGMACAGSEIEAVERGLLELLERDAFMLAWSNRLSLPRVDCRDHAEAAALERRHFAPSGLAHEVVDLSAFHDLPTMLAVAVSAQPGLPGWLIYPAWGLSGIGAGLTMSSVSVLLLNYTNDADRGADSAALQLSDATASAVTTGVAGVLVAAAARGALGYTAAFTILDLAMAAVALAGVLVAGQVRAP